MVVVLNKRAESKPYWVAENSRLTPLSSAKRLGVARAGAVQVTAAPI